MEKADSIAWGKICNAIYYPEPLLAEARRDFTQLQSKAETKLANLEHVQKELDSFTEERQWVITQARKGRITEEDMEYQLSALGFQDMSLKRELAELNEAVRLTSLDGWEAQAREYLSDTSAGLGWLNTEPKTDNEKKEHFEAKRQIVKMLVDRRQSARATMAEGI